MHTKEVICWQCEAPNQVEDNTPELLEALQAIVTHVAPEPFGRASRLASKRYRLLWLETLGKLRREAEETIRKAKSPTLKGE